MNAELLLAHYDRISDASDAVARLRKFILDLAVRGKLVEQDSKDQAASHSLERIVAAKIKNGRSEKRKKAALSFALESNLDLPTSWVSVQLADLVTVLNGRAYSQNELLNSGTPVLRVGNLFTSKHWYYSNLQLDSDKYCGEGDLIFAWSASFGPFIWQGPKAIFHYHIWKLALHSESDLDKLYLYHFLSQQTQVIKDSGHGISMVHMTKENMEKLQVPLPPLAEQHRIVAKIDELMALCDRLEASRREQESRRDQLTASAHHHLSNGEDAEELRTHAQFFIDHLSRLTKRPDQIKQLRQTILNLAVRGKLVPQTDADEPVMDLLQRIQTEQKDLIRRRVIKGREYGTASPADEAFIEIPQTWQFVFLGKILTFGPQNGISPTASSRPEAPRSITLTATTSGTFKSEHFKQIEANIPADSEFWIRQGDLLFQRGNTREYVGMAAYYDGEPGQFLYPDLIIKVRPTKSVDLRYIHLCSTAPYARAYFGRNASGAQSTMPKINHAILVNLPIPLPPFAEQHRIVAMVDELMALCDKLEARLSTAQTETSRLLESVLHHALEASA